MEILKLIDENDKEAILKIIQEHLPEYECTLEIGPTYDTDHNLAEVYTTIPQNKVVKTWKEIIVPLQEKIEQGFGETYWEWYGLCKCGTRTSMFVFSSSEENDNYCCICSGCSNAEYRETRELDSCRVCGKKYDSYKDGYYFINFEARITDETKNLEIEEKTEEEDYNKYKKTEEENEEEDYNKYKKTEEEKLRSKSFILERKEIKGISDNDCCSLECAKKAYTEWLNKILSHPFTKECLCKQ